MPRSGSFSNVELQLISIAVHVLGSLTFIGQSRLFFTCPSSSQHTVQLFSYLMLKPAKTL